MYCSIRYLDRILQRRRNAVYKQSNGAGPAGDLQVNMYKKGVVKVRRSGRAGKLPCTGRAGNLPARNAEPRKAGRACMNRYCDRVRARHSFAVMTSNDAPLAGHFLQLSYMVRYAEKIYGLLRGSCILLVLRYFLFCATFRTLAQPFLAARLWRFLDCRRGVRTRALGAKTRRLNGRSSVDGAVTLRFRNM